MEEEEEAGRRDCCVVPALADADGEVVEVEVEEEEEEEEDLFQDNHQQAAAPNPAEATAVRARARRWLAVSAVEDISACNWVVALSIEY